MRKRSLIYMVLAFAFAGCGGKDQKSSIPTSFSGPPKVSSGSSGGGADNSSKGKSQSSMKMEP
jgi:hypothetical protein